MKVNIGSITMKLFLAASLCLALSSCIRIEDGDGATVPSDCPPGHYLATDKCQSCDLCPDGQVQLLPCSTTENSLCVTCQQLKMGIRCLNAYGEERIKSLMQSMAGRTEDSRQQHPCLTIDPRVLGKLNSEDQSEVDTHLQTCAMWEERPPVGRITKRETTATELATDPSEGSATTTVSTSTDQFLNGFGDDDQVSFGISRKKSRLKGWKSRAYGRGRKGGGRKSNEGNGRGGGGQQPPQDGREDWPHHTPAKSPAWLESDLPHQIGDSTPDQQIGPSISNGRKGVDNDFRQIQPTNEVSAPTSNPKNTIFGSFNPHITNDHDAKNEGGGSVNKMHPDGAIGNDNSDDSSSSSSSSSSSWWSDHTEWLYSLMAAGVVILALSVFIASRLNVRAKRGIRLTPKKLNVNANNGHVHEGTKEEGLEMCDLDDLMSIGGSPIRTLDSPRTRNIYVSYESDTHMDKNKHFSLCHSQSSTLETSSKPRDDSWLDTLKSTSSLSRMDWLVKTNDVSTHNDYGSYHSEAETQTERETLSHNSKTVFNTKWQFSGTFSKDGGVLQRDNSDVSLVVGRDAVAAGQYVTIHGAIFTDASEIRTKFGIGSDEMLITPLVEYHAQGFYQFHNHVAVKLPHALPDDFDASFIKFYTFSVDDCGNVLLESLPMRSRDNTTSLDLGGADAFWEISNQGRVFIAKTKHFSGYFCTMCESKSKLPSVYARVFGSHIQIKSSRREVRLILYLWDRRLNIKDFIEAIRQQECDMDRQLLADEPIPLLDNASSDSSIVMRMETLGDPEDQELWRHVTRSNASRPLFKPLQVRKLRQIVLCCQQNDPMRVEWAMENVPGKAFPSNVFQCLIEMVHIPEGVTDYEQSLLDAEEEDIRTFYVRNLKMAQPVQVTNEDVQSRQELLKKTMTHILDRRDMEGICQAFGMNKKDIGNLSRKFDSDDALKTGLLDECSKKYGMDQFLQALPQVLQQTQLFHVIEYLKDRDLLSATLPSCKQQPGCGGGSSLGSSSSTAGLLLPQSPPICLRQLSESTVCKSISNPQFELESRQQRSDVSVCVTPSSSDSSSCSNSSSNSNSNSSSTGGHNHLRLQIHNPGSSSLTAKKEDSAQVSPDSDYNSPSTSPLRYQGMKNNKSNGGGNARNTPTNSVNNITAATGDLNLNVSTLSKSYANNTNNNNHVSCDFTNCDNVTNNSSLLQNSTSSYNNHIHTHASIPDPHTSSSSQNSSSMYSHSNNCSTVSDVSDFDDSCLATIDSVDLQGRNDYATSALDSSTIHAEEETSRKELAVLGQQQQQQQQQQPEKVKDVAYPEIPEEKLVSRNGPRAVSKVVAPNGVVLNDNKENNGMPSPSSNGGRRDDVLDDTFVKDTYI